MFRIENQGLFLAHKAGVYRVKWLDDRFFLSAGGDGRLIQWNKENSNERRLLLETNKTIYSFDIQYNKAIVGVNHHGLVWIDIQRGELLFEAKIPNVFIYEVKVIQDRIWVLTSAGEVRVYELTTGTLVFCEKWSEFNLRSLLVGQSFYWIGDSNGVLYEWDVLEAGIRQKKKIFPRSIFTIVKNGNQLILGGLDARLMQLSENLEVEKDIPAHLFTINQIVDLEGTDFFLTASKDKTMKIWSKAELKLIKVIDFARYGGHTHSVNTISWNADSKQLISGSDDRNISLWKLF